MCLFVHVALLVQRISLWHLSISYYGNQPSECYLHGPLIVAHSLVV